MISKERIEEFKKLYFEKFNVQLTDEEATRAATDLINLVRVVLKPSKVENK